MSMPAWLNDAHPLPNGDNGNGAFNQSTDPMSFMHTPTTFEYNRPQQQDLPQHLQNADVRNGSPAFHNPLQYQTQPIIPSKRPRPREDSAVASPRQAPGGLPTTRSQTPQQGPYSGLQGSLNGAQQFQGSTPYQHYSTVSSTASQSPVMQNQMFNQPQVPQRVQTISPALFSPPPQGFGQQGSPVSSEHGSRNNTPQNGGQSYMQGIQYGGNQSQPFTPPAGANHLTPTPGQYSQGPSSVQQQQQMYEIRQQHLMRQLQANNAARQQGSQLNSSMNIPNQMSNYQIAARAQQIQQPRAMMMKSGGNADQFIRTIASFMQQRGLPFNPHPTVAGRPINLLLLFSTVMRMGGSKKVSSMSQWPMVAQHLQIPPPQYMLAAQELHNYWQHNLAGYEQRQRIISEQMRMAAQNGDPAAAQGPWSPMKQAISQSPDPQAQRSMHAQAPAQPEYPGPAKHMPGQNQDPRQAQQNGYLTPQQISQGRQPNMYSLSQSRSGLPTQATSTAQRRPVPQTSGAPKVKEEGIPTLQERYVEPGRNDKEAPRQPHKGIGEVLKPNIIPHPEEREAETHGGLQACWFMTPGPEMKGETTKGGKDLVDDLSTARPWVPSVEELGLIDIRALILSLRSGLHAEVRLALDTLATMTIWPLVTKRSSRETGPLSLHKCEDLLEVLVECAEEQLDILAENAPEVSDDMLISSYEDTVRGCGTEAQALQEVPAIGTLEYDLERSVDRLICITTVLRNFSDSDIPETQKRLADPILVKFMTTAIRYLGTRNMLLQSHQNTLDFSKDIVILLSNLSQEIDLPGKEEALCILHFLLSFAPSPPPTTTNGQDLSFPSYEPLVHRYYPYAVESLAKLLARDDPNRTFYRLIFHADSASSPPYDILTRTFGLATAGIPRRDNPKFLSSVQFRIPILAMGLLAAEIIASLIPSPEHKLARLWLGSQDGFASSLVEICFICGHPQYLQPQQHPRGQSEPDPNGFGMITQRGIAVLLKLAERSKDPETSSAWLPSSILPKKDRLLQTLLQGDMEGSLLRQICIYAGMEL